MSNVFSFEEQPFEAYSESDPENSESELTESEWEEEIRHGRPFSPRGTTGYRPPGRPPRPMSHRAWPPKRRLWGYSSPPLFVDHRIDGEPAPCICPVHGTEFVRWVQSSLNHVLGLRLPVTGIMNAATRSALRRFQEQHGLPVDGIAGPETKEALVRAGGGKSASTQSTVDRAVDTETGPWDPASEIDQALKAKNWGKALELAIEAGQRDEVELANLIFFAQNPQLPRAPLDPKAKKFKTLSGQWRTILTQGVRSAIERMSVDNDLAVHGKFVAERDPQFWGANGKTFRDIVRSVAAEVDLNPGFLSAVLLAEVGSAAPYLKTGPVFSFFTGTDDFFAQRERLKTHVPAFANVHFDKTRTFESINETGRKVRSIFFDTGKDAARATAVYLAYARIKLQAAAKTNGGDFDTLPVQVQFALMRIAMAAGHGGIELNGNFVWFLKKDGKSVQVKAGTKGAVLVGVALWLYRVLKGEDILVRDWTGRAFPSTAKATSRNATILVAQALHLSDWHFGIPLVQRPKRPVRPW